MALQAKLFRFKIELSNTDQSAYHSLDLRVAQHPSETDVYLITRVLAYALSYEQGLEFSTAGLSDPDGPSIKLANSMGDVQVWIEIGNPAAKKLHKASKASKILKVFTYKDPQVLLNEMRGETIHRKSEIQIYSISSQFLEEAAQFLKKENRWSLVFVEGTIMLSADDFSLQTELKTHQA